MEDNGADAQLLLALFAAAKCSARFRLVHDGEAALHALAPNERPYPDLMILDLNLPRRDGREVLREVRAREDLRRMPVLVLTSSDSPDDVRRCYDLGANCVLNKPLELDGISAQVRAISDFWLGYVKLPTETSEMAGKAYFPS